MVLLNCVKTPKFIRRKSMSAFTGGIKRPQVQNQSGENNNQQQNQYDRLVTVLGYNTEAKTLVCEDEKGKKYEVFVNPEEVIRGEKAATAMSIDRTKTWMGHSIDKQMEKNYPAGSKLILQRSRVHKKDNGQGMAVTEVQRVIGVPNPEPDKTFQGIFTLTARTDENRLQRVARVQHWQEKGIDVNDESAIQALKQQMDESSVNLGQKIGEYNVTLPSVGVQFRALMKTDRPDPYYQGPNKEDAFIYEVVNTSIPFDWMPGPLDESGKEIKSQAHPITGDEMLEFMDAYIAYISEHEQFKDHIDDMIVEICAYRSYPASNNKQLQLTFGEQNRDQHAEKNPLYQLSHRKSYVDMDQTADGLIQGRNYAVRGIIQISPNKLEKIGGKPTEIPSYWVNNLHANSTKGHVMALVRTSQDYKAEPHANLKLIVEAKKEQSNDAAPAPARAQAPSAPAPAAAPAAPVRHEPQPQADLDDFDPFATPEAAPVESSPRVSRFGKK
jgi:hypothetical protein